MDHQLPEPSGRPAECEENAPITYLTAEAPPVFLSYPGESLSAKPEADIRMIDFGLILKKEMDALKVECQIAAGWPAKPEYTGPDKSEFEFLLRHFGMKQWAADDTHRRENGCVAEGGAVAAELYRPH